MALGLGAMGATRGPYEPQERLPLWASESTRRWDKKGSHVCLSIAV